MLRIFATLLFVCTVLANSSCERKPENAKPQGTKIGFIVPMDNNEWFQVEWKFADEAAKNLGFELQKRVAVDGEKVQTALETFGAQGVQGVIICSGILLATVSTIRLV